jgi:hypothetical protein
MEEMELILDEGEGSSRTPRDICHGAFLELSENVTKSLTMSLTKSENIRDVVNDVVSDVVSDAVLCISMMEEGTDG